MNRLYKAYFGKEEPAAEEPEPARRALDAPFNSPPYPTGEYQGYPLLGVPSSTTVYPLMKAIYGGPYGPAIKDSGIQVYGWVNSSGNYSTSKNSNLPDSYWIVPNRLIMDQTDRPRPSGCPTPSRPITSTGVSGPPSLYGTDYRYHDRGRLV